MRCGLGAYINTASFCFANQFDPFLGGNMADMIGNSRFRRQPQISLDLAVFALGGNAAMPVRLCIGAVVNIAAVKQRVILAVCRNDLAERFCSLHCLAHQPRVLNAPPVVGKSADIRCHSFHIRQCLSLFSYRDCSVRKNPDNRIAGDDLCLLPQMLPAVRHRRKVRHGAQRRKSAAGTGGSPRCNRFFIQKSRFS